MPVKVNTDSKNLIVDSYAGALKSHLAFIVFIRLLIVAS